MSPHPSASPSSTSSAAPERRRTPAAARGPYLAALGEAWRVASDAGDPGHPALALAIAAFARDGQARGVPLDTLLRALDTVVRPTRGGAAGLDVAAAREWGAARLIRAYLAAD